MIRFPKAKINIGLYITEKRPDGYHNIESVFYPVNFNDVLEAVKAPHTDCNLEVLNLPIAGNPNDNLVYKAWELLHRRHGIGGIDAWLIKNIPMGAGLGGGSSDGAHMLVLLNALFDLQLSTETLENYAAELGSDCPFFIQEVPRFVSGRGEVLAPCEVNLSGYHVVLIHPGIHVGTREAYSLITPRSIHPQKEKPENASLRLHNLAEASISDWQNIAVNDFEEPVCAAYEGITPALDLLRSKGALFTSMSGSGSAVYGIFDRVPELEAPPAWTVYTAEL